jgi:hypothetical protein
MVMLLNVDLSWRHGPAILRHLGMAAIELSLRTSHSRRVGS